MFGCSLTGSDLVFDWHVTLGMYGFETRFRSYLVHRCDFASSISVVAMLGSGWSCTVVDAERKTCDPQSGTWC